jgi:dTDP-glucose pyrophosphorylase
VDTGSLLIPLAGAGQRFVDAGFSIPKPLLQVAGLPMVIQAARHLPPLTASVFLCRREHVQQYALAEQIRAYFPAAKIGLVESLTAGQASTCLLGEPFCDPDLSLLIGACDNGMLYSLERYYELFHAPEVEAVIWTFRHHPTVLQNPAMYGWVQVAGDRAVRVSCKVPISNTPGNDHAIVGTFSFKRARDFFAAARQLIASNRRINGEFYVDEVINVLIEQGLHVKVFEIDHYVCWGTPQDLQTFQYWENFFKVCPWHPLGRRGPEQRDTEAMAHGNA